MFARLCVCLCCGFVVVVVVVVLVVCYQHRFFVWWSFAFVSWLPFVLLFFSSFCCFVVVGCVGVDVVGAIVVVVVLFCRTGVAVVFLSSMILCAVMLWSFCNRWCFQCSYFYCCHCVGVVLAIVIVCFSVCCAC